MIKRVSAIAACAAAGYVGFGYYGVHTVSRDLTAQIVSELNPALGVGTVSVPFSAAIMDTEGKAAIINMKSGKTVHIARFSITSAGGQMMVQFPADEVVQMAVR